MTKRKKNNRPSATQTQSFRVVSLSGLPTTSPIVKIRAVQDTKRGSRYILWEDIRQQFGDVQYVMNDGVMIPFIRDANCEDILPQRIETQREVILEVVLQESKQDADDDASSMPDLELLSIADPDLQRKPEDIHLGGTSNAQKGSKNAQEAIEVKALYYLTRQMEEYEVKITEAKLLQGEPLQMLSTLALSDNFEMQRTAAHCYCAISREVDGPVSENALTPLLRLLQSKYFEVQQRATEAMGRLSYNSKNKSKIVELGAIGPLIRLLLSPDIVVQGNASGCICSLSQLAECRPQMVRLGVLSPLVRLLQIKDGDLQGVAAGALSNISGCEELVEDVVNSGAVPFLIGLLDSSKELEMQELCAEAIWNISFNEIGREQLSKPNTKLATALIKLSSSTSSLLQLTATKILSFMCMDQSFQIELVKEGGIPPLLRLLESDNQLAVRLPMFCLYTIFRDSQDRTIFATPKIIKLLIDLTRFKDEDEMDPANLAIFMLLCLAKHSEYHKMIVDAGVFERFYSSVSNVSEKIQIQMTSLIYKLRSALDTKSMVVRSKLVGALINLTKSSSDDLQMQALHMMTAMASILSNHSAFQKAWHGPDHNLQELLCRMLESSDGKILIRGLLSIENLLEKGDDRILNLVFLSDSLKPGMLRMMHLAGVKVPVPVPVLVLEGSEDEMVLQLAKRAMEIFIMRGVAM